ncbi:MAG: 6-phosphogluconolactonase [Maribacter sp.]
MVIGISKKQDYSVVAADYIEQTIATLTISREKVFIALSGGSTPLPILEELSKRAIAWDQLFFFMVDERIVPLDDSSSNFGAISKVFFNRITSNSFSMVQKGMSTHEAIKAYESTMRDLMELNAEGFPVFDLILLGMGDDGHTASLFPGTSALKENSKWVVENKVPQLNTSRITLTYPTIISAKEIMVLVKGQTKKQIYRQLISDTDTDYPMQRIVSDRKDVKWILEEHL